MRHLLGLYETEIFIKVKLCHLLLIRKELPYVGQKLSIASYKTRESYEYTYIYEKSEVVLSDRGSP